MWLYCGSIGIKVEWGDEIEEFWAREFEEFEGVFEVEGYLIIIYELFFEDAEVVDIDFYRD